VCQLADLGVLKNLQFSLHGASALSSNRLSFVVLGG
jgi:hypothetical protein